MTGSPYPPYCIIDNPLDPVVCDSLADIARRLLDMRGQRKLQFSDDMCVWGDQPDEQRTSIGVRFIAADSPADHPRIEESRIVFTGKGEQTLSLKEAITRVLEARRVAA